MDPDGVYYGNHHRPPPEPSAPPIDQFDQECLLSAPRTASLDPPEEDLAALTMDHGSSGRRAHNLEPSGPTDDFHDGVINPVAATYAIPSIADTNLDQLPVASAVPIVTDAVGPSSDTTKGAAPYERKNSTAPNASRSDKTTRVKKESGDKPKKGSLAELRLQRQEREAPRTPRVHNPSSDGQYRDANGKLVEHQPSRNERLPANPHRAKPSSPDKPKSKESTRGPVPSFFQEDDGNTEWDKWLEKQKGKTSSASARRAIPSFFREKKDIEYEKLLEKQKQERWRQKCRQNIGIDS